MYPFSYVDIMRVIGSQAILISGTVPIISKQDNLCTVVGFFIIPLFISYNVFLLRSVIDPRKVSLIMMVVQKGKLKVL